MALFVCYILLLITTNIVNCQLLNIGSYHLDQTLPKSRIILTEVVQPLLNLIEQYDVMFLTHMTIDYHILRTLEDIVNETSLTVYRTDNTTRLRMHTLFLYRSESVHLMGCQQYDPIANTISPEVVVCHLEVFNSEGRAVFSVIGYNTVRGGITHACDTLYHIVERLRRQLGNNHPIVIMGNINPGFRRISSEHRIILDGYTEFISPMALKRSHVELPSDVLLVYGDMKQALVNGSSRLLQFLTTQQGWIISQTTPVITQINTNTLPTKSRSRPDHGQHLRSLQQFVPDVMTHSSREHLTHTQNSGDPTSSQWPSHYSYDPLSSQSYLASYFDKWTPPQTAHIHQRQHTGYHPYYRPEHDVQPTRHYFDTISQHPTAGSSQFVLDTPYQHNQPDITSTPQSELFYQDLSSAHVEDHTIPLMSTGEYSSDFAARSMYDPTQPEYPSYQHHTDHKITDQSALTTQTTPDNHALFLVPTADYTDNDTSGQETSPNKTSKYSPFGSAPDSWSYFQ